MPKESRKESRKESKKEKRESDENSESPKAPESKSNKPQSNKPQSNKPQSIPKSIEPTKIRDYKNFIIEPVDIAFGANIVLASTKLSIQYGEHYGLIGKNGIGKTSLLNAIAERRLDVPERLDMIYVKQEEPETSQTVIDSLLSADPIANAKHLRLAELEKASEAEDVSDELIEELDLLSKEIGSDAIRAKISAQKILLGLGFSSEELKKLVKDFSGGWRMRISLAKALFMTPTLLILDEPTNHLDLHASLWLTSYLKTYPKIIIVVSHDQYFIDEVCTQIIHIHNHKLNYHKGNYAVFQRNLQAELDKIAKDWNLHEKKIEAMRKAKKTPKEISEFTKASGIIRPEKEYEVKIKFMEPKEIKGIFLTFDSVSFGYKNSEENCNKFKLLYHNLDFVIQPNSRIAFVGKNGIGKSTLLKLMTGDLEPIEGEVIKNSALKIGYYGQHFEDSLPMNLNGIDYLLGLNGNIDLTSAHKYLSMFGLEPIHHKTLIGDLSGGQKARVKLASFGVTTPHLLILDEPSNHLDIVAIESLINALNHFTGAVVLVTHNFDLITKINSELWVVDANGTHQFDGDYDDYIQEVINEVNEAN